MKIILGIIVSAVIIFVLCAGVPFVYFGKIDYYAVFADACAMYDLDPNDYELELEADVVNAEGQDVQGYYRTNYSRETESIVIKTSWSKPMVVATIFHELAHAKQRRYHLDLGDMSLEQHAEMLAFKTMWHTKYKYHALHMLTLHTLHLKNADYLAGGTLWNIALTK